MKRAILFLAISTIAAAPCSVWAQEAPETRLDFARKLRERGYNQLALEYLEKFGKEAPPGMKATILVETARTRVTLARDREPEQRAALYADARKELTDYVANNAGNPDVDQARLDVARMGSLEAQALMSMAYRAEDPAAKQTYARRAEAQYQQSGRELELAEKLLANPRDKLLARFELGKNLLDQAGTYFDSELRDDPKLNLKRAKLVAAAAKVLEDVEKEANKDDKNPALHLARAWLIRTYQEATREVDAKTKFKKLMTETAAEAKDGQRIGRFFNLLYFVKEAETKKEAQAWLQTYPASRNSAEGLAIRFMLGQALLREAEAISKDPKDLRVKKNYDAAQREFASLANSDFSQAQTANKYQFVISFRRMGENTPIDKLRDFEECYLKARYEMFKMQDAIAKAAVEQDPKKREALVVERQQHLRSIIRALNRGLFLASDSKATFQEIAEARYYLTYTYLLDGDPFRAAIAGEELARVRPPSKRSSAAAGYALQAYATVAARTNTPSDRERLHNLASFILSDNKEVWANDPVTQVANYQLGLSLEKDGKLIEALGYLDKIKPEFAAYTLAQCQLGNIALRAARDARSDGERQALQAKALAALQRVPTLPAGADDTTATVFFFAQLGQGNVLYDQAADLLQKGDPAQAGQAAKKLAALDSFTVNLRMQLDDCKADIDADSREKLGFTMDVLRKLGRRGLAEVEYRAGRYERVLAADLTGDIVNEVKKRPEEDGKIKLRDWQVTGELLGLALCANVQTRKISEAKVLLGYLSKLTDELGAANSSHVVAGLVQDLSRHIKTLQSSKSPEAVKQLSQTKASFAEFLRELQKQPDFLKNREQFQFLASCYSSLDLHKEAADLYKAIPVPKVDPKKKLTPAELADAQYYWQMQFLQGHELRLAKDYKEADAVLRRVAGDPTSRAQFLGQKELLYLQEDQGLFGSAATGWNKLLQTPVLKKALTDNTMPEAEQRKLKETYFECYYQMTFCLTKYALSPKNADKKVKYLEDAATYVARLEMSDRDGWQIVGPRFQDLLTKEKELGDTYAKVKAKMKPASK